MLNDDDQITAYTIDEKMMMMWEKQTAKLHEEGKYARESARNYGDRVRCVVIRCSLSLLHIHDEGTILRELHDERTNCKRTIL